VTCDIRTILILAKSQRIQVSLPYNLNSWFIVLHTDNEDTDSKASGGMSCHNYHRWLVILYTGIKEKVVDGDLEMSGGTSCHNH